MARKERIKLLHQKRKIDWWIAGMAVFIALFGLLMVYESSNVTAFKEFGDQ